MSTPTKTTKQEIASGLQAMPRTGYGDKVDHAVAGVAIFGVAYAVTNNPHLAISTATFFGGAKEIVDYFSDGGVAEWADFFATIAPALAIYTLILLL